MTGIVGIPQPFSGSTGGEPVLITSNAFPGQVMHGNSPTHTFTDVIESIVAVNANTEQVPLYCWIAGPGLTPPTTLGETERNDIPPTYEGREPTPLITPLVLQPGYEFRAMVPSYGTGTNQRPLSMHGEVIHYEATDPDLITGPGYGGLITLSEQTMPNVAANAWGTVPFEAGQVTNPVNVTQDPANNRFSIDATGIWQITVYGVINVKKKSADRYAYVRFWNETLGQPNSPTPFPVPLENGNNFGMWSFAALIEIDAAAQGDVFRLELGDAKQIGGGDVPLESITVAKAGIGLMKEAELPTT